MVPRWICQRGALKMINMLKVVDNMCERTASFSKDQKYVCFKSQMEILQLKNTISEKENET